MKYWLGYHVFFRLSIWIVTSSLFIELSFLELGTPGFTYYKEKFTKLDNEKRLKEAEVIEGGYLELGFTFHHTRFEVIEMDSDTCMVRTTIEYDVKEEAAANASYATIDAVAKLAELAKNHLIKNKASKDTH